MIKFITEKKHLFEREDFKEYNIIESSLFECLKYFENHLEIELDTETHGFDPYTKELLTIQLGDKNEQFVIEYTKGNIELLKPLLESNKTFLLQNAKFDLRFFLYHKINIKNIYDTLLVEAILTTGIKNRELALDKLAEKYLGIYIDKTIRGVIHKEGLTGRVVKYAAEDVEHLGKIKEKQLELVKKYELERTVELENKFVRVLAKVELDGFKLNTNQWQENIINNKKLMLKKEQELNDWMGNESKSNTKINSILNIQNDLFGNAKVQIKWNSSTQVIPLFKFLGVDTKVVDKKTGKIKDSVESKHLKKFKNICSLIPIYIEYKEAEKLISTYGVSFLKQINKVSGRLHTNFWQILDTGRTSSGGKDKINKTEYLNFQNIPSDEEIRKCFIAEEGNVLIVCDYSQQEPRITADKCGDKALANLFINGDGDTHSLVASKMYSIILGKEVIINKENQYVEVAGKKRNGRQDGKILNLKLDYGGSAFTVKDDLAVTEKEAQFFIDALKKAFPDKEVYFQKTIKETFINKYITINIITKRKVFIDFYQQFKDAEIIVQQPGFWDLYKVYKDEYKPTVRTYFQLKGKIERNSKNYPVQGTGADMIKLAGIYFLRKLEEKGWNWDVKIPNEVHDEWVAECKEEIANEVSLLLQNAMEEAGKIFCQNIPIIAEPKITKTWQK